ncbi:bifunctional 3-deoxy-7-phosphoheptulonate synthase/chorismate mutase type II [Seonamhaeicola aphaedonensis]|uniref:chorismate mutase n=1 Tax=Seonamhaeicola aphaedonensis TaxID=1461338 RepID=A0A3D9HLJ2_9FLAO|nr:bifunctional 3-deoxy-7-phosphoheptulonate synthase/chorismate mutase type II [Seonamhaeicola aphaedonensis]RED50275.1 3-deoxy-D-arabinoheptulosonate-7-phosphate synthase [Seonamhaeicola aphaedonensis]
MENNKEMRAWLDDLKLNHPLVIAGPCSAETEEQVLKIAHELKDTDVNYFRAGIWKPRTRPGMFEGVGALGLKWLQKVKAETGMKVCTEVANAAHVKLALEHDIDMLWIGARSTVSPFIMQEIADALEGTEKPVLIKNPVNPDLALWLGGIERIYSSGVKNIGAIHRGFSTYEKTKFRNNPEWQMAIEFQNKFPDIPLINDPSHITGKRDMVFDISQIALDLNFDGLMIETHHDPENAWSDASQQVTPNMLIQMMRDLKVKKEADPEAEYNSKLDNLRAQIDVIDNQIIDMLGKRMQASDGIGKLKKEKNVAVLQSKRWNEILGRMVLEGQDHGLSEEFVLKMFKAIHQESINHQEKIING